MQVSDAKGDVLSYPKAVLSLPFTDTDDTFFYLDDYHVNCAGDYVDAGGGKVRCGGQSADSAACRVLCT